MMASHAAHEGVGRPSLVPSLRRPGHSAPTSRAPKAAAGLLGFRVAPVAPRCYRCWWAPADEAQLAVVPPAGPCRPRRCLACTGMVPLTEPSWQPGSPLRSCLHWSPRPPLVTPLQPPAPLDLELQPSVKSCVAQPQPCQWASPGGGPAPGHSPAPALQSVAFRAACPEWSHRDCTSTPPF